MIFKISPSSSGFLLRLKRVFSSFQGPRDFWRPRWPLQFETQHGTTKSSKSIHITFDNARRAHLRAAWTGAIRSEFNLSTSIKFLWWHVKQRNRFNKPMSVSQNYGPLKITRNGQFGRKPMELCWAPTFWDTPQSKIWIHIETARAFNFTLPWVTWVKSILPPISVTQMKMTVDERIDRFGGGEGSLARKTGLVCQQRWLVGNRHIFLSGQKNKNLLTEAFCKKMSKRNTRW